MKWISKLSPANWLSLILVGFILYFTSVASANPSPQGQSLRIYAGGGAQATGFAYGSEHTDARVYYAGNYHNWVGCYRSTWSIHMWICNNLYVPPGYSAFAQIAYYNLNGWSFGYSPWVYSFGNKESYAAGGVLG